jgi:hypothetical protein
MSTPDEMRWEAQRLMIEAGITTDAGARRGLLDRALRLAVEAEALDRVEKLKPAGAEE